MRCLLVLALVSLATPLAADTIHLKNGGTIEGKILSRTEDGVEIQLGRSRVVVAQARIQRIELGPAPWDVYRERAAAIEAGDLDAHLALALWAKERSLPDEADEQFERVLAIDPDHGEARRLLGHRKVGDRWMTGDEYREHMRSTGHVYRDGRWVDAEEIRAQEEEKARARDQRRLQLQVNHLVRLMGAASVAVADKAYRDLVALADLHAIPGLREAAVKVRDHYRERRVVTMEVHATNSGPTDFRQVNTTLGGGTSPVTIELPSQRLVGVHATVQVPAGSGR